MESSDDYRTTLADFILSKVYDEVTDELRSRLSTLTNDDDHLHRTYAKPNEQKLTLLTMACLEDRQGIVRILLEHFELDLEILNDVFLTPKNQSATLYSDTTALWAAAASDNLELEKLLVEHGARVNHKTKTNSTALRCACGMGNLAIAQYLIQHGADVHVTKEHHDTNLLIAVCLKNVEIAHYLVEELGCDINECDDDGRSPLYEAVKCESVELIEYLLKRGARNSCRISSRFSPLLLAAENRRIDLMELISVHCPLIEQIEAKELLGSSFAYEVEDRYDPDKSFIYLSQALELRSLHQLPKTSMSPTLEIFNHRQESQTVEQLEEVYKNTDDIRIEVLLVRGRVLGSMDEEYLHSVGLWGALLLDDKQFDRGLAVWLYKTGLHREHSLPLEKRDLRCLVDGFAEMVLDIVHAVLKLLSEELNAKTEDFDDHLHSLLFLITITAQVT
jgi:Fem-1 homolog b